jgi:cobyrinic acid a,c-diamide synthase
MARGFVVAGTASGVGKTTVTAGIAAALLRRGLAVQPFKAGPDYIDPSYLGRAAAVPCRNLDTWMLDEAAVRELFARAAASADVAVVEGVMGLFDGRSGEDEAGSTAQLAKLLGLPVVLVVDASAMARSAAAAVMGYQRFDPALQVAGVVLNRVGSERHAEMCTTAIEQATGVRVLGWLPRDETVALPERHLGLIPESELRPDGQLFDSLAELVERQVDLDALLTRAAPCPLDVPRRLFPREPQPSLARIAIARDRAFNFYYEDSLDLLRAWGAELLPFSPLEDERLPEGAGAVYIGGGFPELYAGELAANASMHAALREAAAHGLPVYGECGGLMYLGRSLVDLEGQAHQMVGLVPADSAMTRDRLSLGYREAESRGTPLLPAGERARGHEFHWSTLREPPSGEHAAYWFVEGDGRPEGFRAGSVTATYLHTHLAARLDLARNFVAAASRSRAQATRERRA